MSWLIIHPEGSASEHATTRDFDGPPPTLVTHYVTDVFDLDAAPLCVQAAGGTSRSLGYGHWYTAARDRVTCTECLDWLHA